MLELFGDGGLLLGTALSDQPGSRKLDVVALEHAERVSTWALDDVASCGEMRPVPGDSSSALAHASGRTAMEARAQAYSKTLARPRLRAHIGSTRPPTATSNVASLGGDLAVAVATGLIDPTTIRASSPDALDLIDLASGEQTKPKDSTGAFAIGMPAFDPVTGVLLVPDAGGDEDPRYRVLRFDVENKCQRSYPQFLEVAPHTTLAAHQILRL